MPLADLALPLWPSLSRPGVKCSVSGARSCWDSDFIVGDMVDCIPPVDAILLKVKIVSSIQYLNLARFE